MAWYFTAWAIYSCGGLPQRLQPDIRAIPSNLDGIVIGGGDDINPVLYDEPDDQPDIYDAERDAFESEVIEFALTGREIPMLGICRGAQLLNVLLGGSLFNDIRHMRERTSNRDTVLPLKSVRLEPDSRLQGIIDAPSCPVNSLHHQAIDRTGRGLRVVGRDQDQIVQAIEHPEHEFLFGVQWHPEYLPYLPAQRRIFQRLIQIATGTH